MELPLYYVEGSCWFFFEGLIELCAEIILAWASLDSKSLGPWKILISAYISLIVTDLLKSFSSYWINFHRSYVSGNSYISVRFPSFVKCKILKYFLHDSSKLISVCYNVFFFIPNVTNLGLLSLVVNMTKCASVLLIFSKS